MNIHRGFTIRYDAHIEHIKDIILYKSPLIVKSIKKAPRSLYIPIVVSCL